MGKGYGSVARIWIREVEESNGPGLASDRDMMKKRRMGYGKCNEK